MPPTNQGKIKYFNRHNVSTVIETGCKLENDSSLNVRDTTSQPAKCMKDMRTRQSLEQNSLKRKKITLINTTSDAKFPKRLT